MRTVTALLAAGIVFLGAACGGGDAKPTPQLPAGASPAASRTGFASSFTPTPEAPPFGAPPKIIGNQPAFTVVAGRDTYIPTFEEFKALPTVQITVAGKTYRGVSLASLAERMKANPQTPVSVQGYGPGFNRQQFIRYPLAEIGSETVLLVDPDGYISVVSTKVPEGEWLRAVISVGFP
jgi:hypothetical protein